jgi:FkbM family methyltransferase
MRGLAYDVGMNAGHDTDFYLSQGFRVVAVEANPELAEAAERRFSRAVGAGMLDIVNAGVAEQDGVADFWICDGKSEFSSFHRAIASRVGYGHHAVQIPTVRFASLMDRFGTPDVLKVDIEGNDRLCLEALSPNALPRFVSLESECTTAGVAGDAEEGLRTLMMLRDLGYRKFKLIDQLTFTSLALPSLNRLLDSLARNVLLEGPLSAVPGTYRLSRYLMVKPRLERRFGREFPLGSSGAIGSDMPGRWIGYAEAARAYRHYRARHFRNAAARHWSFWCDWHATL